MLIEASVSRRLFMKIIDYTRLFFGAAEFLNPLLDHSLSTEALCVLTRSSPRPTCQSRRSYGEKKMKYLA